MGFFKDKSGLFKGGNFSLNFFEDKFFAQSFVLLIVLNSLYIVLAQLYNLPKLFDLKWWYSLFFREAMLFCTYFMGFCVIYALPFRLIKRAFVCFACLASVLLLVINIFLVLNCDATLNDYLVGVAFETNPGEAKEFITSSYFSLKFALCTAAALVLCFLAFKFGGSAFWAAFKGVKKENGGGGLKASKALYIAFTALLIALVFIHIARLRPTYERSSDVLYNAVSSLNDALNSVVLAMKEYEQISRNFDDFIKDINISKAPQDRQIQNIVLIIGESAQRNLMQIYGYYLPNTPNLSKLKASKSENLLVFSDVIAAQVYTLEALSQVLSFANQEGLQTPWYQQLNLIDAMRLGGYKNVVISNQEQFSVWAKANTIIFKRSDDLRWTTSSKAGNSLDTMKPDGAVVGILDEVLSLKKPDTATFYTFHLMGSHNTYFNRYPREFDRFKASDIKAKRGAKAIAEYANSILYTDFVLDEIIKRFADSDSIVIYLSDHGDDVFDTSDKPLRSDTKPTRFMLEIPFIVYMSDEFIAKHPKIHARLKAALDEPFMSDDLMHTIIDIAGFEISGFEPKRSLLSDDKTFLRTRPRMIGKKAQKNYDKELKNQPRVE